MKPHAVFLAELVERIGALSSKRVQRVAIDGVDGAGKTRLADELARALSASGRPVIRASVDGFHNNREIRYRRGKTSPEGFYRDSYNYPELKAQLLEPLSPGGSGNFKTAIFDVETDLPIVRETQVASTNAILLFDGIFLHRKALRTYWDLSIFLQVPFEISIPRGAQRGTGSPDPAAESNVRYIEGQKLYLAESTPEKRANVVVDYGDLQAPQLHFTQNK